LKDGLTSVSSATTSPSTTVSSGIGASALRIRLITTAEVLLVARSELYPAAGLDGESAIAIEHQLGSQPRPSGNLSVRRRSIGSMKRAVSSLFATHFSIPCSVKSGMLDLKFIQGLDVERKDSPSDRSGSTIQRCNADPETR
jgi:hypothetical protein